MTTRSRDVAEELVGGDEQVRVDSFSLYESRALLELKMEGGGA